MKLHVILRTCANSLLTPLDKSRVCGTNRELMMRKCFVSLVHTIKLSGLDVHLTVLDDHSDLRWREFVSTTAEEISLSLISMPMRGSNHSALAQIQHAKQSDGMVYVVEDDYLHEPHALAYMMTAYENLSNRYRQPVIIYPYDCSLRYQTGQESECMLYHDGVRYWRSVDKTALTLLTHASTFQNYWQPFEALATRYPHVLEDDTINKLYKSSQNPYAPIRCFNPIPSVAYHVGYSEPTHINTTHASWKDLWNQIPNWCLVQGWFSHAEFYSQLMNKLLDQAVVVEVGAWRGSSTVCMASLIKQSGKQITFHSVDTWHGTPGEQIHDRIKQTMSMSLFDDFKANLAMCEVQDVVNPLCMTSVEASMKFDDHTLDFVMIDGGHDYECVAQDIESWRSKLKPGGIMAGDDYSESWPGVVQAVNDAFGDQVQVYKYLWWVQL
jgi:hypothetical protein